MNQIKTAENEKIIENAVLAAAAAEAAVFALLKKPPKNEKDVMKIKNETAKKFSARGGPAFGWKIQPFSNARLLQSYHNLLKKRKISRDERLEELLTTSKIRSLSGIVVVSVLTKPYHCRGKCLYCPTQKGTPKSYLANEPAVIRAIKNRYDPYLQTQYRLRGLQNTGHPTDKINIRIIGGTWSDYPRKYRLWFVKRCFEACNDFNKKSSAEKTANLESAQKQNEKAKQRIVEISVETRPDCVDEKEIKFLRELGVTKVELGIQSLYDDVLNFNRRGHLVAATIRATEILKNAGFKVSYQMMLNLPGSNFRRDAAMFKKLFADPAFRPDCLKIYPLAIVKEAPVYALFKRGKINPHTSEGVGVKPYSERTLIKLLKTIKKEIPWYCRVERVIRDIPSPSVVAGGVKISHLRDVVAGEMKKEGTRCRCIRCREIKERCEAKEKAVIFRQDYESAGGKEIFLTFETKDRRKLFSLLRLRIPTAVELPTLENSALIRELHTYGKLTPLGKKGKAAQHKSFGKKLVKLAEKIIAKEFGFEKIAVISGVGARNYWRKLGYKLKDTYMIKKQ